MKQIWDMWTGKEVTIYENAHEAFRAGKTYRPKIFGIGSRAQEPREEGCELSEDGKFLMLIDYQPKGYADGIPYGSKKTVLARKEVA